MPKGFAYPSLSLLSSFNANLRRQDRPHIETKSRSEHSFYCIHLAIPSAVKNPISLFLLIGNPPNNQPILRLRVQRLPGNAPREDREMQEAMRQGRLPEGAV